MTVIAYRDGVLATDSLVTAGDRIMGSSLKAVDMKGVLFACAGSAAIADRFMTWVRGGMKGYEPSLRLGDDWAEIYAFPGEDTCIWWVAGQGPNLVRASWFSFGCGADIACGAMAMGASPAQAVRCAISGNVHCGGEVRVYRGRA